MDDPPKEYHFHVYFHADIESEVSAALSLRQRIVDRSKLSPLHTAVPLERVNHEARGPHPIGSYEVTSIDSRLLS